MNEAIERGIKTLEKIIYSNKHEHTVDYGDLREILESMFLKKGGYPMQRRKALRDILESCHITTDVEDVIDDIEKLYSASILVASNKDKAQGKLKSMGYIKLKDAPKYCITFVHKTMDTKGMVIKLKPEYEDK